ncbi:MAG: hypothetical protein AAGA18_01805 [Verrucomicrobiota bacterium]
MESFGFKKLFPIFVGPAKQIFTKFQRYVMKHFFTYFLLFISCALPIFSKARGQSSYTPEMLDYIKSNMTSRLDSLGYHVVGGNLIYITPEQSQILCALYGWNCQANNPTTPYGVFMFPKNGDNSIMSMDWKLAENEAIVFVGVTPPKSRYFGIVPYIWSRYESGNEINLYASLGDTLNNAAIKTSGPNQDSFNRNSVIIMTRDWQTDAAIRKALTHPTIGLSPNIFNTYAFPKDPPLRMGYVQGVSDSFTVLTRIALLEDQAKGEAYMENPPAFIMKVRPKNRIRATVPLGQPKLRTVGSGVREQDIIIDGHSLQGALDSLEQGIKDYYSSQTPTSIPVAMHGPYGFDCIYGNPPDFLPYRCIFENRDAGYNHHMDSPVLLPDDPSNFFIVYGVNHRKTGKVAYHNVAVSEGGTDRGIISIDDRAFAGTADRFTNHPLKDYLYAIRISRNCADEGAPSCYEVPSDPANGIELDQPLYIMFRYYLEYVTGTRPSGDEMVLDRVLLFK